MKDLNRYNALRLLPAIIDNEATEEEKAAFSAYINHDDFVRMEYENHLYIKKLLKQNFMKKTAPESFKNRILEMIDDMLWESGFSSKVDNSSAALDTP